MHQTSTGTKKTKNNPATTPQKWTHSSWICFSFLSFWGPVQVWCNLVFCFLFWCLCRLGDSDFTKHWQAPIKKNKTKPLDAPNIGRHQKKTQCPTTTQKWTHRSWIFSFFACAGLVTLTSQNIDRQQQKKNTRCTKHRQAPNKQKKIQQLLRSGPIVPVFFCVCFLFCWCLCRFGDSASQNIDKQPK